MTDKRDEKAALDEYIRKMVAEAPPLSEQQRRTIASLLVSARTRESE